MKNITSVNSKGEATIQGFTFDSSFPAPYISVGSHKFNHSQNAVININIPNKTLKK